MRYRDPSRRQRTSTFERKIDAEHFAAAVETDMRRGEWVDPRQANRRLSSWAEEWFASVEATRKPGTVAAYRQHLDLRVLPRFGTTPVAQIRPSAVEAWIGELKAAGLAPATIRTSFVVLSSILESAARDGAIARNPAKGASLPRVDRKEAAYLDLATVDRLASAAPEPYGLLIRVLATTGIRWGELVALRRRHVDLMRRRLVISENATTVNGHLVFGTPKGHRTRHVPVPRELADEIAHHLEDQPDGADTFVFVNRQGRPLRYQRFVESVWRPALAKVGLPRLGLHVLRHSAAAALDAAGASPKAIQSILGHASAGYTLTIYGHVFDETVDDVADRLQVLRERALRPVTQLQGRQDGTSAAGVDIR